ncbi:basic proline-rich protein-like [Serinus canaria]|uniref:basic proline-rich protein-like n=1 Tax=Serinus canaria TaxID=9135 RepID=UPI0021CC5DB3|nr:basic proline-rich protein-like [Serinus canaria]
MLWLPAREEQDLGGTGAPRSREQAQGRGRGGGSAPPSSSIAASPAGPGALPRGTGPRKTPATRSLPAARGPLFILEPKPGAPSRGPSPSPALLPRRGLIAGVPPAWRCCWGPCCWRRALPWPRPCPRPCPRPGSWRAPCWRRTGRSCGCCGCWEWPGRASTGGPTSASTSRPGSRPAPSPPRTPAAAGAARAGCSAARPRCPCSPSCPTCRCRWWSAAGSRSSVTAPCPVPLAPTQVTRPPHPHHHPRGPPCGLGPLPVRPCRDRPAAPCPQRSCNKEISGSDVCVCAGDGSGDPGAPSALGNSDGATLGLCNPAGTDLTRTTCHHPRGPGPQTPRAQPRGSRGWGPRGVQMPPPITGTPPPRTSPRKNGHSAAWGRAFPKGQPRGGSPTSRGG